MSAWYIFTSLGFYPVAPGSNQYVIGAPFLDEVSMTLPAGDHFKIISHHRSAINKYIQSVKLNGKPLNRAYITHTEITDGGILEFFMGSEINEKWGSSKKIRPYSLSADPLYKGVKK